MDKYVIWIVGANASGKSTLSALIQKHFKQDDFELGFYVEDRKILYTQTSEYTINLGKFNHPKICVGKTNACCGTDTLAKKELIALGLEKAGETGTRLIFVEGIMATRQWVDIFPEGYKVILVLLDLEIEQCIQRLMVRRSKKTGQDPSILLDNLTEKTVSNLEGKINGFRRLFEDLSKRGLMSFYFHSSETTLESAADKIINYIQ